MKNKANKSGKSYSGKSCSTGKGWKDYKGCK